MRGSATGPLAAGGTAAGAIPVTGPTVLTVYGEPDLTTTCSLYVLAPPPATGDLALLRKAAVPGSPGDQWAAMTGGQLDSSAAAGGAPCG